MLNSEFKKFPWKKPRPKLVGILVFLLALYPQSMFYSISMSSVASRISSLVISFNAIKKQGETSTQRSTKRLWEDTEHVIP